MLSLIKRDLYKKKKKCDIKEMYIEVDLIFQQSHCILEAATD